MAIFEQNIPITISSTLNITHVLATAWRNSKKNLGTLLLSLIIYTLISGLVEAIFPVGDGFSGNNPKNLVENTSLIATSGLVLATILKSVLISLPLLFGLLLIPIKTAEGELVRVKTLFSCFRGVYFLRAAVLLFLIMLVTFIISGLISYLVATGVLKDNLLTKVVLVLVGMVIFYGLIIQSLAASIIADRKAAVLRAIKLAFHAFNKHWLKMLIIVLFALGCLLIPIGFFVLAGYLAKFASVSILLIIGLFGFGLVLFAMALIYSFNAFGTLYYQLFYSTANSL